MASYCLNRNKTLVGTTRRVPLHIPCWSWTYSYASLLIGAAINNVAGDVIQANLKKCGSTEPPDRSNNFQKHKRGLPKGLPKGDYQRGITKGDYKGGLQNHIITCGFFYDSTFFKIKMIFLIIFDCNL